MAGETNLKKLLREMSPQLHEGTFVFCTVPQNISIDFHLVQAMFREQEAMTVVLQQAIADQLKLQYSELMAWISLNVHSSLEAVGLTASIANVLADAGLSCNVMAAYYHDHIFVSKAHAHKALQLLRQLSKNAIT